MDGILNWLWQGGIVACATMGLLRLQRQSRAHARYLVWCAALFAVLVLPFIPLFQEALAPADAILPPRSTHAVAIPVPNDSWTFATVVLVPWAVWSIVYTSRVLRAVVALARARQESQPVLGPVERRLHHWTRLRLQGRRTRLVLSERVETAAVLGGGAPVIAVSPRLVSHLTDEELDQVVIHEWAHVQRGDDIANVIQVAVRVIAGWHPAIWYIDRQLQVEREMACDEIVIDVTGSAKGYAVCLAQVAGYSQGLRQALPAIGMLSAPGLRGRIVRILAHRPAAASGPRGWSRTVPAVAFLSIVAPALGAFPLVRLVTPASVVNAISPIGRVDSDVTADNRLSLPGREGANQATGESGASEPRRQQQRPPSRAARLEPAATQSAELPAPGLAATSEAPPPIDQPLLSARPAMILYPSPSGEAAMTPVEPPPPLLVSGEPSSLDAKAATPWSAAADAGVAIGRGSARAATSTAGFFSRFGRKITSSF